MAIINNNVQNVKFLRNQDVNITRDAAIALLNAHKADAADGTALLARYTADNDVKTLVGFVAEVNSTKYVTIFDVEGASADVEALRQEIDAKLGTGITSANTATAQLAALRGNTASTSGETSVEGAKRYAEDLISTLDGGVTAETGYYVKSVSEVDGKISGTTEALPSVSDTAVAKKFVTEVSETNGVISVSRGEITSTDKTVVLTDGTDGGIDFKVNIDGETLIADTGTGVISVASAALTQYVGDDNTIQISAVDPTTNTKTISSPLTIQKVTTGLSEEVKEEYHLVGHSGNTIGDPVKIYKDSHIVSITYITDTGSTYYQNLEYKYIDASGNTQTTHVDMSELVIEAEFASGVTVTDGVAHGVVDSTSETFLTVGADGFKLAGVQDAINAAVASLDADESCSTEHITVNVVEENGVITTVTVEEDNIANANDLAGLSAKTVTALTSTNGSITANIDDAVGCKTYDIQTDADKIKMSGFSADSTSALSGIAESDSIATAFEKTNAVITENERVTAQALTDLDGRLDVIESGYVETVKVNNVALAEESNAVNVQISSAPSSGAASSPITVNTDNSTGAVTLVIQNIDCGYYE